jgi:hypothetical protein
MDMVTDSYAPSTYILHERWRETAIPAWRKVLREAIEKKQDFREKYARWILKDILEDPEVVKRDAS